MGSPYVGLPCHGAVQADDRPDGISALSNHVQTATKFLGAHRPAKVETLGDVTAETAQDPGLGRVSTPSTMTSRTRASAMATIERSSARD